MIAFITGVIWHSGMIESPLMNLYLLVIIACAITLGRNMTVLEVVLIAHLYLYMGYKTYSVELLSPTDIHGAHGRVFALPAGCLRHFHCWPRTSSAPGTKSCCCHRPTS